MKLLAAILLALISVSATAKADMNCDAILNNKKTPMTAEDKGDVLYYSAQLSQYTYNVILQKQPFADWQAAKVYITDFTSPIPHKSANGLFSNKGGIVNASIENDRVEVSCISNN